MRISEKLLLDHTATGEEAIACLHWVLLSLPIVYIAEHGHLWGLGPPAAAMGAEKAEPRTLRYRDRPMH